MIRKKNGQFGKPDINTVEINIPSIKTIIIIIVIILIALPWILLISNLKLKEKTSQLMSFFCDCNILDKSKF